MMLFKLSVRGIRRSLRDYAIYFFTLIIGVSVFYVFNAIGSQAAMLEVSKNRSDIIELITAMLSSVSVFVACVLGLLIVYASRFLMKRRSREFALYLILGMGKRKISAILLIETVIIGLGSLAVGLLVGIALSQLMSALVAGLFEADMSAYRFSVSGTAILRTILYFAVMYLVVMLFNTLSVGRMKLLDLMQSGRRSERIRMKHPLVCMGIFLLSAAALVLAYHLIGTLGDTFDRSVILTAIALGAVSTFGIFWSASGMLLRLVMSMKRLYFRSLNSFTFRQLSSKVNTMVFSMTVICLMLFVTICTLTSAFSIRNSMNRNLREYCCTDFEMSMIRVIEDGEEVQFTYQDIARVYADAGEELTDGFERSLHFATYADKSFTMEDSLGSRLDEIRETYPFLHFTDPEEIIRVSDYNALRRFYGKETVELAEDEFILLCNFYSMCPIRNMALYEGAPVTIFGTTLHSRYAECRDGFIDIGAQPMNAGLYVVPDDVVDENCRCKDYFAGVYAGDPEEAESTQRSRSTEVMRQYADAHPDIDLYCIVNTKQDIYDAAIGLGAMVTFLGLYIGLVFLIACGAILALRELSECVDSIPRYEMLRKIGAEEADISRSLLRQTEIFFLFPLLLAVLHSVFGMKFASYILEVIGTRQVGTSVTATSLVLAGIYGGYFLVTYFCSKGIIRGSR